MFYCDTIYDLNVIDCFWCSLYKMIPQNGFQVAFGYKFTSNFMQGTASLVATTQQTTSRDESLDTSTMSCNETLALLDSPSSDQLVPPSTPSHSYVETVDRDMYDMQVSSPSSPLFLTSVQFLLFPCLLHLMTVCIVCNMLMFWQTPQLVIAALCSSSL